MEVYPGVEHGFAFPQRAAYDKAAAERHWERLFALFGEIWAERLAAQALEDLVVVEAAAFIAGPTCGLYLAQIGAEVIRIDQIGGGPDFRRWPLAPNGDSLYWEGLNKGKKSVVIDLGRPEGRELAQRLAAAPGESRGLFVTNFPVEGFLSYERLRALRDDVICVRVMGWADGRPALDYTINAAVGVPFMTGFADDPRPVNHVFPAWDFLTGAYAALSLVSAERARRLGQGGCEVRIPLSDIAATTLANFGMLAEVMTQGQDRPRLGNDVYAAFGRDFVIQDGRAADGGGDHAAAMARGGQDAGTGGRGRRAGGRARRLVRRPRGGALRASGPALSAVRGGVRARRAGRAGADARRSWRDPRPLSDADRGYGQRCAADHEPGRDRASELEALPDAGACRGRGRRGAATPHPAPRLGQHTDEALSTRLGLSSAEIGRLHDEGLVAQA